MADASKTRGSDVEVDESSDRPLKHELWGLVLLTSALCLFLALVSFSKAESGHAGGAVNLIGPVGAQLANVMLEGIGLCSFFFDGVLFYCGFALLFGRQLRVSSQEGVGYAIAIPSGAMFLHLVFSGERVLGHKAGGVVGELGAEIGRSLLGSVGMAIMTVATLLLAATLITETNPSLFAQRAGVWLWKGSKTFGLKAGQLLLQGAGQAGSGLGGALGRAARWRKRSGDAADVETFDGPDSLDGSDSSEAAGADSLGDHGGDSKAGGDPGSKETGKSSKAKASKADKNKGPEAKGASGKRPRSPRITIPEAIKRRAKRSDNQLALELIERDVRGFTLPPTGLLSAPTAGQSAVDQEALKDAAERIEKGLLEFKVKGEVTGITPGPVVTMFEFEPAPGVKLSTISNLSADLARVIRAQSVRIVAPIPGKGVVGIEVPNEERETVYLRELLEDKAFQKTRARLPLAIGKDISGEPVVTDLARMPHLLVAGATGSGKSVSVNAMITSLLYHSAPTDVRMIMVDPKMLELSIYEGVPHLLVPVVTDPQKAATALKWAVAEMDRRYRQLKEMQVRNIGGYNRAVEKIIDGDREVPEPFRTGEVSALFETDDEGNPLLERMPYIVIVIDEFADLMMVASKDVEMCVARLAQKARAAGVHLILATQRPSVDVITGLIKANFPTRISFRVFSRVDSRTVLDTQGAEHLLGMGDMLFRPPGRGDLHRVHGAYVDEKEILKVVDHLKEQGEPRYQEDILQEDTPTLEDLEEEEVDEMYDLAVELVTRERKASISMVQRKLRVGYNRAARMIEMMEREGVVGTSDGRGTRDVLAPPPP